VTPGLAQDVAAVAAARAPEGIEDDFDAGGGDGLEIDQLGEALEVGRLDIRRFRSWAQGR
jgi:hypothetical protein